MRKLLLLLTLLFIPFRVSAETKIDIFFFWQTGCPYCENAKLFFQEIETEYEKYYNLHSYNVGIDDNKTLMNEKSLEYGENVNTVPYIIIGSTTSKGYSDSKKDYLKNLILTEYNKLNNIEKPKVEEELPIVDDTKKKESKYDFYSLILLSCGLVIIVTILYLLIKEKKSK